MAGVMDCRGSLVAGLKERGRLDMDRERLREPERGMGAIVEDGLRESTSVWECGGLISESAREER